MIIKATYNKEKGLVEELDISGDGGFFVNQKNINASNAIVEEISTQPGIENAIEININTDIAIIDITNGNQLEYINLPDEQNQLLGDYAFLQIIVKTRLNAGTLVIRRFSGNDEPVVLQQVPVFNGAVPNNLQYVYYKGTWRRMLLR